MWISPKLEETCHHQETIVEYSLNDMDERPWGRWEVIDVGSNYVVKKILIKPGFKSSLQTHKGRNEHWIIISGVADVTIGEEVEKLLPNQTAFIPIGITHRIGNSAEIDLIKIEIQTGHLLSEDDITRLEDEYGRV